MPCPLPPSPVIFTSCLWYSTRWGWRVKVSDRVTKVSTGSSEGSCRGRVTRSLQFRSLINCDQKIMFKLTSHIKNHQQTVLHELFGTRKSKIKNLTKYYPSKKSFRYPSNQQKSTCIWSLIIFSVGTFLLLCVIWATQKMCSCLEQKNKKLSLTASASTFFRNYWLCFQCGRDRQRI